MTCANATNKKPQQRKPSHAQLIYQGDVLSKICSLSQWAYIA